MTALDTMTDPRMRDDAEQPEVDSNLRDHHLLLDLRHVHAAPEMFPRMTSMSAAFVYQAVLRAETPEPPEYVTVPLRVRARDEASLILGNAVAQWNLAWEAAQFRRRMFDEDDLPPQLHAVADRGDLNVIFVPRTRSRYYEYAPLLHLLPQTTLQRFGLPLLRAGQWPYLAEYADLDQCPAADPGPLPGALAERAIKLWPGPTEAVEPAASTLWQLMNQALAELLAGSWTTYGDLAVLIGSHPVPVGMRLASHPAPNAHRVLQASGALSPGFRWLDPRCTDDPLELLRQEGVVFDDAAHADPAQRVTAEELAELVGLSTDGLLVVPDPAPGKDTQRRDRFVEQLSAQHDPAVISGVFLLLDTWTDLGGTLGYGAGKQTSCFLLTCTGSRPHASIWPLAIYPSGKAEVVFQHLASRPPFDDLRLREELRQRLNAVPGIDLPASKLQMRPSFQLDLLADPPRRTAIVDCLTWFLTTATCQEAEPSEA